MFWKLQNILVGRIPRGPMANVLDIDIVYHR